jgi:hypothetical protein
VDSETELLERLMAMSGEDFSAIARGMREVCTAATLAELPAMGKKAPACYANVSKLLGLLEVAATCGFGCPGPDYEKHLVHRLLGRVVAHGNEALSSALGGYYDESLALSRTVGEIANLLWLCQQDEASFTAWRTLNGKARWAQFRPKAVRQSLEAKGCVVLVKEDDYSALSGLSAHPSPDTSPQNMGLHGRPTTGGQFRPDTFLISLNEIAYAVAVVALAGIPLFLKGKPAVAILELSRATIENVGGARASNRHEIPVPGALAEASRAQDVAVETDAATK